VNLSGKRTFAGRISGEISHLCGTPKGQLLTLLSIKRQLSGKWTEQKKRMLIRLFLLCFLFVIFRDIGQNYREVMINNVEANTAFSALCQVWRKNN
jgi:hypothetical protein